MVIIKKKSIDERLKEVHDEFREFYFNIKQNKLSETETQEIKKGIDEKLHQIDIDMKEAFSTLIKNDKDTS